VSEIDAASNNGVDSIRDLRDEAAFTPGTARYRVYIIDEVHMLSTQAFNALLKTLEEPPAHVIFVLATTEIQKVLPTIVSRCQRFDFRRIEPDVIAGRLQTVAEREGFTLRDDAAGLIARLADGGMRDALSLLDVCAANSSDVTIETVTEAAGLVGRDHLFQMTEHILAGDTAGVLTLLGELTARSLDPQRLCEQLSSHFRDLMIAKTVEHPEHLLGCLPSEVDALRTQGRKIALSDLLTNVSVLQDALVRMAKSLSKRAELELALIMMTEPAARTGTQALLARIERLEKALRERTPLPPAEDGTPISEPAPAPTPVTPAPAAKPKASAAPASAQTASAGASPSASGDGPQVFRPWPQVLDEIAAHNTQIAGMMMGTKAFFDGKRILIDIQNPVLLEMLRNNEFTKKAIRQAIAAVTGREYPIGPYRTPEQEKPAEDPLEKLIASLPSDDSIHIH
jgi:DNA polymerase-3 subunit gamma/tau